MPNFLFAAKDKTLAFRIETELMVMGSFEDTV